MLHPEYVCNKVKHDIAVLVLEKSLEWSEYVSPACLPTAPGEIGYQNFDNNLATVAGWGWTNEHSNKGMLTDFFYKLSICILFFQYCFRSASQDIAES